MTHTRPPIIAVVGHIDHGKSKLQRAIRRMDTHTTEAGDITQHIGAYELHAEYEGAERRATIIDTPGHEAFSHIREHGLNLADLALLVVSAEEGLKEQTREAHTMIKSAGLPYIVVFTKIDVDGANLEMAKQTVLKEGVLLEGLGGDVPWAAVSSVTNEGINELIELIFLTTDIYEIVEHQRDDSVGILIEADIDPREGIAGTIIVLQGSLENKDYVRVGGSVAPLRIMKNDRGETVSRVVPSTPVRVVGFDTIPSTGEAVFCYETKRGAIEDTKKFQDGGGQQHTVGNREKSIPLVLRSDTASGLTSIEHAIGNLAADGVAFTVIKRGVGSVTEEDVRIAVAQDGGQIVGFHTVANQRARVLAENKGITINLFPTIYELTDWVTDISRQKKESYEITNTTGESVVIRVFEKQEAIGVYIIGAQIKDGVFRVGQSVVAGRGGAQSGRFVIESIEQRNKKVDEVSGEKTQFAVRIKGTGAVALQDTLLALPDITEG